MIQVDVLVGLQWGDEGKGKIAHFLGVHYDWMARFQGGCNAGHTVIHQGKKFIFHHLPAAAVLPQVKVFLGPGMVLYPPVFVQESQAIDKTIHLSGALQVILPTHLLIDVLLEQARGKGAIGTTKKGIGPAYADKALRQGIPLKTLLENPKAIQNTFLWKYHQQWLRLWESEPPSLDDFWQSVETMRQWLKEGKLKLWSPQAWIEYCYRTQERLLAEGAQGTLLDLHFGTYPYVTSTHTVSGSVYTGLGVPPNVIKEVFGVFKAYMTRVGQGPFPTELQEPLASRLREWGKEYGATTGRPRRCGWLDLNALQYACKINGVTQLIMTKADVLAKLPQVQVFYQDQFHSFPSWNAQLIDDTHFETFCEFIEKQLQQPIVYVSYGPETQQIYQRTTINVS